MRAMRAACALLVVVAAVCGTASAKKTKFDRCFHSLTCSKSEIRQALDGSDNVFVICEMRNRHSGFPLNKGFTIPFDDYKGAGRWKTSFCASEYVSAPEDAIGMKCSIVQGRFIKTQPIDNSGFGAGNANIAFIVGKGDNKRSGGCRLR